MKKSRLYITFLIAVMILNLSSCAFKSGTNNKMQDSAHEQGANSALTNMLFGTKWELIELKGKIIDSNSKPPFIKFERNDNKAFGNGGCNSFSLQYYIMESDSIKFSDILSTKMACDNIMIEQEFFSVLAGTGHILINKDTLQLSGNFKVLAKFNRGTEL